MAETLLSPLEVAQQLMVPIGTLYNWRTAGKAPRAYRVGKHLRFRQSDVDAWLEQRADAPRSSAA